jgi:predicted DNA-binding ribbon-helix-helix protein
MTSTIVKHTIEVAGRKTSLSLEDAFWQALKILLGTAERRCVIWLLRSILSARTAISRQLCGNLCSTTLRSALTRLNMARRLATRSNQSWRT